MESVQVFAKDEIAEFYGVDKKALMVRNMLNFLVKTKEDLARLQGLIDKNSISANPFWLALCDLQGQKLEENKLSFQEFLDKYSKDKIAALEELFQMSLSKWIVERLEAKISSDNMSLERLYELHILEPHRPLLSFVK